jgi:hypothetical protein
MSTSSPTTIPTGTAVSTSTSTQVCYVLVTGTPSNHTSNTRFCYNQPGGSQWNIVACSWSGSMTGGINMQGYAPCGGSLWGSAFVGATNTDYALYDGVALGATCDELRVTLGSSSSYRVQEAFLPAGSSPGFTTNGGFPGYYLADVLGVGACSCQATISWTGTGRPCVAIHESVNGSRQTLGNAARIWLPGTSPTTLTYTPVAGSRRVIVVVPVDANYFNYSITVM